MGCESMQSGQIIIISKMAGVALGLPSFLFNGYQRFCSWGWGWWKQLGHEVIPCLHLVSGLRMSGAIPLLNFLFIEYWGVLFLRVKQPGCVVNHFQKFLNCISKLFQITVFVIPKIMKLACTGLVCASIYIFNLCWYTRRKIQDILINYRYLLSFQMC